MGPQLTSIEIGPAHTSTDPIFQFLPYAKQIALRRRMSLKICSCHNFSHPD